ncbi:avirulence protein 1b [Phytophthora sojae]|uniref:RxLR effector protein Avh5 n=2 Tax=Phytophthora sojae TaxID=67593 RepID=AVH5_PHYSP|nr:avirulence protein 1b [Phytophthora sojae]E0W547.1 RecName: Full=RxLR effector protein Avh5; AltName: Full=Avirulence homolog protein 5; Flags: Precursor [Phytophthora sojae]G4ZKT3.1 RecName: Full=RxLR effector protein Avh5; AltName: Full=Avirulence homolog protein 5; Flags: Precursor [Phytophthora sojae strain P6497]AEK80452.1 Avh5 [Phytophthora sojae]AEK80453.1 Avh5 [Phytophthora sojae]AEK80454.1 Avh5 [Phytophthora sojae]EGZ14529.1 avirulence protein 1b [Phytophthora sojae]|eukprot:XP_009528278.1 avirulence protein 1b [Phytophthora sojae]
MRLQFFLVMAVATLATISATRVPDDANLQSVNAPVQTVTRSRRFLRTADTDIVYEPKVHNPGKKQVFIEDKLQKALTDPKKNKKLYARWYNSGFTVKQVEGGLDQNENRELELTYKNLALGYAKYYQARRSQEAK